MEAFHDAPALWGFTAANASYNQMHDADFMSLIDKQFPGAAPGSLALGTAFDRSKTASSSRTSPSEESPSPTGSFSDSPLHEDGDSPAAKRKAAADAEEGPSSKTLKGGSSSTRRKAGPAKDETRLMKRKEQNRAAQRAFRERKEKHVKDLEDKVAQLEAKNDEAVHENENLRDLLTRLQTENVMLKQGQFTFSMPRDAMQPFQGTFPQTVPAPPIQTSFPPPSTSKSPKPSNPLDWSSLTTFDPSRLNLLDDPSQQRTTATDTAMQLDFGFGPSGLAPNTPYTTLASNPMFMSFASSFDPNTPPLESPNLSTPASSHQNFNFDMSSLTTWPTQNGQDGSLDDLLQGYLGGSSNQMDFTFLTASPVSHHTLPSTVPRSMSSSSSPSSTSTDPLHTPKDSPTVSEHGDKPCPKTKAELVKRIEESGPSPFGPTCRPSVRKSTDSTFGPTISCDDVSSFPKTQKNEQNVEVLSAWRSITSNPKFKDTDISELCAEFTSKARCDGSKVVLEPAGVTSIIEALSKKHQQ